MATKDSTLGRTFWDRLESIFEEEYSTERSADLTIDEIKSLIRRELKESLLAIYYTVLNDFNIMDKCKDDLQFFLEPNDSDLDVLVSNFNNRKIWRTLEDVIADFEVNGKEFDWEKAYKQFKAEIRQSTYSRIAGVKHEAYIVANLRSALHILHRLKDL